MSVFSRMCNFICHPSLFSPPQPEQSECRYSCLALPLSRATHARRTVVEAAFSARLQAPTPLPSLPSPPRPHLLTQHGTAAANTRVLALAPGAGTSTKAKYALFSVLDAGSPARIHGDHRVNTCVVRKDPACSACWGQDTRSGRSTPQTATRTWSGRPAGGGGFQLWHGACLHPEPTNPPNPCGESQALLYANSQQQRRPGLEQA